MKNSKIFSLSLALCAFFLVASQSHSVAQSNCWTTIDFSKDAAGNPLAAGTVIGEQLASWGIHVQVQNNNRKHPDAAVVFDSSNPTGGDIDLGTPNEAHGGPGIGEGGASNDRALGNLLIIAENDTDADGDALIDQPDDEANGGEMTFRFDQLVKVRNLVLVDIDKTEKGAIVMVTFADGTGSEIPIAGLGDNSVVEFPMEWTGLQLLTIKFPGSGAVASFEFCNE